mmetsp:Transcript_35422/g.106691  ORF Transcript_35422/g.106691 Transcript_35422/m.106691 type:complete len:795 (+) Transcript_35422:323-2707(+)
MSKDSVKAVRDLLRTAAIRESNCQLSLRVGSFDECSFSKDLCFTVTLIGDTAKCQTCAGPMLCRCLRDQFQSTTNSKRRVSTFLFWKNKLGLNFPVSDEMLRRAWKGLDSCANGIKQGNGQRKVARGAVCINPYHYTPNKWGVVLDALFKTLDVLGITDDHAVGKVAHSLEWNGSTIADLGVPNEVYEQAFELVCHRVRKMVDSEGYIERLRANLEEGHVSDGGYETGSANSTPVHDGEYFSPSSPPDHFVVPGDSDWSDHDMMRSDAMEPSSPVAGVPAAAAAAADDPFAGIDEVLFGESAGAERDFYMAEQILPRLQGSRHWTPEESRDIETCADGLRRSVEEVVAMTGDDFMELADTDGTAGEPGLSWAPYMSTQVWENGGAPQFASGVDVPDPTAYGLDQFDQVVPDMMSQYCNTSYTRSYADGTVEMAGEVVGLSPHAGMVMKKRPSNQKATPKTAAAQVPTVKLGEPLKQGDVVVMIRSGQKVDILKADPKTIKDAACIGVYGCSGGASRVNLVGLVEVAVSGPVRNLDMLYVDLDNPGKATATPRREPRYLVGQVLDSKCGAKDTPSTVRCIISPEQLKAEVLAKVTAETTAAVRKHLSATSGAGDGDAAAAVPPVDLEKAAKSKVDAVYASLARSKVATKVTFKRAHAAAECDQSVVTLVSHATGKALRSRPDGTVDTNGACGDAVSQFVLHHDDATDTVQLQSVTGDDSWLAMDDCGVLSITADPSDASSNFTIAADPKQKGGLTLSQKVKDVATYAQEPTLAGGEPLPLCFSMYQRDSVTASLT